MLLVCPRWLGELLFSLLVRVWMDANGCGSVPNSIEEEEAGK